MGEGLKRAKKAAAATQKPFMVGYRPDAFTSRDYPLGRYDSEPDALSAAAEYSRMYYGECSAITVWEGKRKIHSIPRGAGRATAKPLHRA